MKTLLFLLTVLPLACCRPNTESEKVHREIDRALKLAEENARSRAAMKRLFGNRDRRDSTGYSFNKKLAPARSLKDWQSDTSVEVEVLMHSFE